MRLWNYLIIFTSTLLLFLSVSLAALEKKESTAGTTNYKYTGSYNPKHRNSTKPVPVSVKQREAFWAAFCNIAVNLARLQDERIFSEGSSSPGWSVQSKVGGIEVMAISDAQEGEQAVCHFGEIMAIFTKEGEISSLIIANRKKSEELYSRKWPSLIAGIKIIAVRYSNNCEGSDCECEMTVEYP